MNQSERTWWFVMSLAGVVVSGFLGFRIAEYNYNLEHQGAQSRCYSTKHADAYVAKLGTDEFVCFREDYVKKKITKSLIVMPDRPLE